MIWWFNSISPSLSLWQINQKDFYYFVNSFGGKKSATKIFYEDKPLLDASNIQCTEKERRKKKKKSKVFFKTKLLGRWYKSVLSQWKDYHRHHKACEVHSKAPTVMVCGQAQHLCHQCSRYKWRMEVRSTINSTFNPLFSTKN